MSSIFYAIDCLTEQSSLFSAAVIQKRFFKASDKRYMGDVLQKFIELNKERFNFIGVTPKLYGVGNDIGISFKSESFIGAIPLLSPENGKHFADFVVYPRFGNATDRFQEYTDLLLMVGEGINPEINDQLELQGELDFKPPLYHEGIKFISLLFNATNQSWRKFTSTDTSSKFFSGNVNWTKYINNAYNPENINKVPTSINTLSENHLDYQQIKYTYLIARREVLSSKTPKKIKDGLSLQLSVIDKKLGEIAVAKTESLKIKNSDFISIKNLKKQGNIILNNVAKLRKAWRIDYSIVFEKAMAYLFEKVSKDVGGEFFLSPRITNLSPSYPWTLNRLIPDIILKKEETILVIDAKYKPHFFNKNSSSVFLKEEFRKDLHQILAYTAFNKSNNKTAFLCYPSNKVGYTKSTFVDSIGQSTINVISVGIPLKREEFNNAHALLKSLITIK